MHLRHPRKRDFLQWDELNCLARALGDFHDFLQVQRYFHLALNNTYNNHTDEWNVCAIEKALDLLDHRILSFAEIEQARIAYQTYENLDTRGLVAEEAILLRTLKLCGRIISPLKMLHRLKHMQKKFVDPERIQLHEFLDLIFWSKEFHYKNVEATGLKVDKNDQKDLYELEVYEYLLSHADKRLHSALDRTYKKDELNYDREKYVSKPLPKDTPPVDSTMRILQKHHQGTKFRKLQRHITSSEIQLQQAKAGFNANIDSTPRRWMKKRSRTRNRDHKPPSSTISSMYDDTRRLLSSWRSQSVPQGETEKREKRRSSFVISPYSRPLTAASVEVNEKNAAQNNIENLQFEIETLDVKYQNLLAEAKAEYIPNFDLKTHSPSMPASPENAAKGQHKQTHKKKKAVDMERIAILAKPGSRLTGSQHGATCDARARGWTEVDTPGHHYILSTPHYEHSNTGLLLYKLKKAADDEIKRAPFIYRYTARTQATKGTKPSTLEDQNAAENSTVTLQQTNRNELDSHSPEVDVENPNYQLSKEGYQQALEELLRNAPAWHKQAFISTQRRYTTEAVAKAVSRMGYRGISGDMKRKVSATLITGK